MTAVNKKHSQRRRRALRVRRALRTKLAKSDRRGTKHLRLSVIRTNKHLHAQLIDDDKGHTLAACSTASKSAQESGIGSKKVENTRKLGEAFAGVIKEKKIERLVFDRGCKKYHGAIAAFADGLRAGGIAF